MNNKLLLLARRKIKISYQSLTTNVLRRCAVTTANIDKNAITQFILHYWRDLSNQSRHCPKGDVSTSGLFLKGNRIKMLFLYEKSLYFSCITLYCGFQSVRSIRPMIFCVSGQIFGNRQLLLTLYLFKYYIINIVFDYGLLLCRDTCRRFKRWKGGALIRAGGCYAVQSINLKTKTSLRPVFRIVLPFSAIAGLAAFVFCWTAQSESYRNRLSR